jgi:hypothetical protein
MRIQLISVDIIIIIIFFNPDSPSAFGYRMGCLLDIQLPPEARLQRDAPTVLVHDPIQG